jgi:hypothetical protein
MAQTDKTQRAKRNLKNCIQTKRNINENIDKNAKDQRNEEEVDDLLEKEY